MRKVFQIKTLSLVAVIIGLLLLNSCKKEFVVAVQSNNEEWGIVKGGGTYAKGAEISIEAIANTGYKFVSWQDGNTDSPWYCIPNCRERKILSALQKQRKPLHRRLHLQKLLCMSH